VVNERPFHNIFVSYRGPSARRENQNGSDPQLEDNATKALINTLELAPASGELTRSFLTNVAMVRVDTAAKATFFLQGGPDQIDAPDRFLLGLSVSGEPAADPDGSDVEGNGRADAAIYFRGAQLLALEVKVGAGELVQAQMARHARRWGVDSPARWRTATWADVYRWASAELDGKDAVSVFLLEELLGFLRASDLTPFLGWSETDFEFFVQPSSERDGRARQRIRVHLAACWEAVEKHLGEELAGRVGSARVQPIKPHENAAAASTTPDPRGVNLTVELWPAETHVNLVGWNDNQVATLIAWLRTPRAERWLREHTEFEVAVFRRFPTAFRKDGRPVWRSQGEEELPGRIVAAEFTSVIFDAKLAQLPLGDHPGIHLRRGWSRERAVELGDAITLEIADGVRMLHPLVEEINSQPVRRRTSTSW
jgi:hypothetical protein